MWMLLAACAQPPTSAHPDAPTPAENDPRALAALSLPVELPFEARSRVSPVTLVDERGQVVLVLSAVGVSLSVERLLADRALVTCTGCRSPVEAWLQRAALFAGDRAGGGPHDEMLAYLATLDDPATLALAAHGFAEDPTRPDGWIAPPWWNEGGYSGEIVVLQPAASGFSVERTTLPYPRVETKDP